MPVKRASGKAKTKDVFGHPRKPAKMLRAALYARVSTLDQQTFPMQMRAMRDYATNRASALTKTYPLVLARSYPPSEQD